MSDDERVEAVRARLEARAALAEYSEVPASELVDDVTIACGDVRTYVEVMGAVHALASEVPADEDVAFLLREVGRWRRLAEYLRRRMGEKAPAKWPIPTELRAELPPGAEDSPRHWCSDCGLADAPKRGPFDPCQDELPCSRCGSPWRWHGRLCDLDGTATTAPPGECLGCYEWRRYFGGQVHFGWTWWRTCDELCRHGHHLLDGPALA